MKKGWQIKTLGELCSFENGDRGENYPSKSVQTTSGVPFINAGHLSESGIDFSDMNYIPRERFELLGNGKIRKDDILFCLRGSLGKFASVRDLNEGAIASSLVIIRPSDAILNEFVLAYLQSDLCAEMIQEFRNGAAQPNLAAASLKKFSIPVPPLAEQQRIVGLLDEAFEGLATAKANAEKNLQNARALFESHLQSVFTQRGPGWVENTLGEICDFSQGVQVDVKLQSDIRKDQSQVRFLRIIDFTQGNDPERFIDNPGEKFLVCQSDISLVRYGASTGFVCRGLEGAIANNLFRVIPKDGHVSKDFLYWFLKSPAFQDEIKEIMNGAAMPAISFGVINEICIAFLPQRDQLAIVNKLELFAEETQRLAHIYERKLAALAELKKSLLHQAFTGEL